MCAYTSAQSVHVGSYKLHSKLIAPLCVRSLACFCLTLLYLPPPTPVQSLVAQLRIYSFPIPILPVFSLKKKKLFLMCLLQQGFLSFFQ